MIRVVSWTFALSIFCAIRPESVQAGATPEGITMTKGARLGRAHRQVLLTVVKNSLHTTPCRGYNMRSDATAAHPDRPPHVEGRRVLGVVYHLSEARERRRSQAQRREARATRLRLLRLVLPTDQ